MSFRCSSFLRSLTLVGRILPCLLLGIGVLAGAEAPRAYHLAAGDAGARLREFSRLSGLEVIYRVEELRGLRTAPLHGTYEKEAALQRMLRDTGLEAVKDDWSESYVVRRSETRPGDGDKTRGSPEGDASAAGARIPESPNLVELSPFEVQSRSDAGYRATQSVSASRMMLATGELPMAVNAFTREFVEDQHAYDLYDIVKWAPGVHQDNVSPQGWVRYNVRGFTRAAVQRNGFSSARFIDTTNIERVEVVKGPASLFYGQINPGGVINYLTKRPEADARTTLDLAAGTDGYTRAVLDVTGPVSGTGERLLGRAIVMHETLPEFQQQSSGRKSMLAPSLTWRWSETASLTLEYERFERLDDMPTSGVILRYENYVPGAPYEPLPANFSYAGEGDYQDFISDIFTAEFNARLGEHVDLRAIYFDTRWDMEWRATGQGGTGMLRQSAIDAYYPPEAGLTSADAMYRRNRWERQWGGERSVQFDAVGHAALGVFDLRALVGAKRIFESRFRSLQRNNPNTPGSPLYLKPWDLRDPGTWDRSVPFGLDALVPTVDSASGSDALSLYGVLSAATRDGRLHALAGFARHSLHNAPTEDLLKGTETAGTDRSANVPQVGVSYTLRAGLSVFASYSESFLANTNTLRVNNVPAGPAKPSVGRGREAGVKLDLWNGRFSGTVSAYEIRANPTDIVVVTTGLAPDGTTLFSDLQGGSQRSRGVEVDLMFLPRDDLQVLASFSVNDAIYVEHPTTPEFSGSPLVATPDDTFSLWAKYAPQDGKWRGWMVAGGFHHIGTFSHVGNNPLVRFDGYETLDLSVGYRTRVFGRPTEIELTGKNIADARYYASASSWGLPRQVILSCRMTF